MNKNKNIRKRNQREIKLEEKKENQNDAEKVREQKKD